MKQLEKYDAKKNHLIISAGLNLKGKCFFSGCNAKNYRSNKTWVHLGFGDFKISYARYNKICRGCNNKLSPDSLTSIGIMKAKLTINGILKKNDGSV